MSSFKKYYRTLYQTFGYPLTARAAAPPKVLAAAEKRLGVRIPAALRDYHLVAGRERRFGACHSRLLAPEQWRIDQRRLIFMEENQCVVRWGVSTRNPASDDPPVSQGANDEPITWVREHRKCSTFLAVMLHYQAVSGGFRFCGTADATDGPDYDLEKHGWTCHGEVNSLMAFSRPNRALCVIPVTLGFMDKVAVSVLAGAKTKGDLRAIAEDLGLTFR